MWTIQCAGLIQIPHTLLWRFFTAAVHWYTIVKYKHYWTWRLGHGNAITSLICLFFWWWWWWCWGGGGEMFSYLLHTIMISIVWLKRIHIWYNGLWGEAAWPVVSPHRCSVKRKLSNWKLPWCQLCRQRRHWRMSRRQPPFPPITTTLALWSLSVFSE